MDIIYLEGESPLLMSNIQVYFADILPETNKTSAFWDMGVDSHLKWLLLFSPNGLASCDRTSLGFGFAFISTCGRSERRVQFTGHHICK